MGEEEEEEGDSFIIATGFNVTGRREEYRQQSCYGYVKVLIKR